MNNQNEKVRNYITEHMDAFIMEELQDDDNIFEKGFVSSIFAVQLLDFIESTFDVTIDDEDIKLSNFSTVNKIVSLIEKCKGNE